MLGTHYNGSREEVRALNAFLKLKRASGSIQSRLNLLQTMGGLTESQFGVLEILLHLGSMPHKDIGRKLHKSGGNITIVIDNLEKRRLVIRRRNKKDRRVYNIHLTKEGRALIGDVFPDHVRAITREMSVLTGAEQKELDRLCRKLGTAERSSG